jgi:hypothetical protein
MNWFRCCGHLDRNDQAVARGFFLTGWSGTQPYTLDRISRGTRHIEETHRRCRSLTIVPFEVVGSA